MSLAVVIPAAGSSSRFGAGRNKLVQILGAEPVIVHTLRCWLARNDVSEVVIAADDGSDVARETCESWRKILNDPRVRRVSGGRTRAHSVLQAIKALSGAAEWVAVHDAARPLVSQRLIDATLALGQEHGAAVPALPVHLTIKRAVGALPAKVIATLPRHELFAMQTPQIARRAALLDAYDKCPIPLEQITDDMQLIELSGGEVWLSAGDERNLKITTQQDLLIAEMLLKEHG